MNTCANPPQIKDCDWTEQTVDSSVVEYLSKMADMVQELAQSGSKEADWSVMVLEIKEAKTAAEYHVRRKNSTEPCKQHSIESLVCT